MGDLQTSKIKVMKQTNSSYKFYLVRLSSTPVSQLVQYFNKMVGSKAWTSERAAHDTALIDALIYKGIDVSAVYDGTAISYKHKISYDPTQKRLSLIV